MTLASTTPPWSVVVVDDDPDVFTITELVLRGFTILGRSVALQQCRSAQEARQILSDASDTAVLITDVVMEQDDAGLQLVRWTRSQPHLQDTRIVIRTGQPGMAPERQVLEDLDINDYWTKQDLSSQRMRTLLTGMIRSYRDLTNRAKAQGAAEAELAVKRERLQTALESQVLFQTVSESLAAGILLIQGTDILFANPTATEMLASVADLAHASTERLPPPLNASPPPTSGEVHVSSGDKERWLAFQSRPVEQDDIQGCLITLMDRTQEKAAELERMKTQHDLAKAHHLQQVGLLTSGVAHDLNNLMTIIVGTFDLLQDELSDPALRACVEDAREACDTATNLAQQMLLYGSGGEAVRRLQDFRPAVANAVDLWRVAAGRVGITVDHACDESQEMLVEVADSQVQQLVGNLASNAIRAMPDGGTIAVRLKSAIFDATELAKAHIGKNAPAGLFAVLQFSDEGVGIPQVDLPHVFDAFYTTRQAGRGLGLATMVHIIERLNGAIFLVSEEGAGTTFTLAIPFSQQVKAPSTNSMERMGRTSLRVLVLDDVALVRRQIRRTLTRRGHQVVDVGTLAEALTVLDEPFDVAVIDFVLEFTTGDVAIQKIRDAQPNLPAILCSGYISPSHLHRTREFSTVIHKPFENIALIDAVEAAATKEIHL